MKYIWEDEDIKSGMDVGTKTGTYRIGYHSNAFHGMDNGWYVISSEGHVLFYKDIPAVVEWLNRAEAWRDI